MPKNIPALLQKLLRGECTLEEINYLERTFNPESSSLEHEFQMQWNLGSEAQFSQEEKALILKKIQKEVQREKSLHQVLLPYLGYAAVFLIIIGIGYLGFRQSPTPLPVSEGITIETEGGNIQSLSSETPSAEGYVLKEGKLVYTPAETIEKERPVSLTLRVPLGKSLAVVLSDSTIVHLNAGSSLSYPSIFTKGEARQVFLSGEAYFEVSPAKVPFTVLTENSLTQVLGTKFNVAAYPEEEEEAIVLLEGKVTVTPKGSTQSSLLKPNQMAVLVGDDPLVEISEVNADDYIAWTQGILLFRDEPFKNILPKLERHYDISIINHNSALLEKRFTGRFPSESITEVLTVFQHAVPFDFEMQQDQIIINQ